jgi:hypothetical protein
MPRPQVSSPSNVVPSHRQPVPTGRCAIRGRSQPVAVCLLLFDARYPPAWARALGSALAYCALQPAAKWRDYLFEWQPALVAGLQLGVFDVSPESCDVIERLIGVALL